MHLTYAGVARGCGWQHLAVYANLATFYCIGMPVACVLGFNLKLYVKVKHHCQRNVTRLEPVLTLMNSDVFAGFMDWLDQWPLLPSRYPLVNHNEDQLDCNRSIYNQREREPHCPPLSSNSIFSINCRQTA